MGDNGMIQAGLLAELRKRTKRPSALITDPRESLFPPAETGADGMATETACTAAAAPTSEARDRITLNNPNKRINDLSIRFSPSFGLQAGSVKDDRCLVISRPLAQKTCHSNFRFHAPVSTGDPITIWQSIFAGRLALVSLRRETLNLRA